MTTPSDQQHPADAHDWIRVRGARENNLRDVAVDLPKRRLNVFTGVSGSGKSSLVFATIAAESQRLINETYTAFVQNFMPSLGRPEVDELTGLSAAIVVDQEPMGANARSTVGTATDAAAMLRVVFSRAGQPRLAPSSVFSFNDPAGMCPACEGIGRASTLDVDAVVDRSKSLNEGAILAPNFTVDSWYWRAFAESGYVDPDTPLQDYTDQEWDDFWSRPATKVELRDMNTTYEGLAVKVHRLWLGDKQPKQAHVKAFVERAVTFGECPGCHGTRLNETVRGVTVAGRTIADCAAMQVTDLRDWLAEVDDTTDGRGVGPLVGNLRALLTSLVDIGLGYLSLDRESGTLSGGEAQRVRMVRHLGSALSDVTYVFDEPTVGLHPADIRRMNDLLASLRDKGNTVLVVSRR